MFYDLFEDVNNQVKEALKECKQVTASKLNLDYRAGSKIWVAEDAIVCEVKNRGSLEYYGGFEYVDKEYVKVLGDYVFYFVDGECRVEEALDFFNEKGE